MYFDHCYQKIQNSSEYFALETRGFRLSKEMMEHPGKQLCRFIHFNHKDPSNPRKYQYLEFVEVADLQALIETYPAGATEYDFWEPGFSLAARDNLKAVYESNLERLKAYEPSYSHKIFKWKEDNVSALPGWNFLEFKKPPVPGVCIWCTEYEPNPDRKPFTTQLPEHPNTVDKFAGFIWNIDSNAAQNISDIANLQMKDSELLLDDGTKIFLNSSIHTHSEKKYPFAAVVFECSNWDVFCSVAKPDKVFDWKGKRAGLIKMSTVGWDILVVEK